MICLRKLILSYDNIIMSWLSYWNKFSFHMTPQAVIWGYPHCFEWCHWNYDGYVVLHTIIHAMFYTKCFVRNGSIKCTINQKLFSIMSCDALKLLPFEIKVLQLFFKIPDELPTCGAIHNKLERYVYLIKRKSFLFLITLNVREPC